MCWYPVCAAPYDVLLLVACPSDYVGQKWVFKTARRVTGGWRDYAGNWLEASGSLPEYWTALPTIPEG